MNAKMCTLESYTHKGIHIFAQLKKPSVEVRWNEDGGGKIRNSGITQVYLVDGEKQLKPQISTISASDRILMSGTAHFRSTLGCPFS